MWKCSPWTFFPILYSLFTAAGLWVVYFIAEGGGKITPLSSEYLWDGYKDPPYISNAGDAPPASCVFSKVMNMAAFGGFILGVLRYLQLKQCPCGNVGSLLAISLACIGMTLVGNFQLSNQPTVHNVGAVMAFVLSTLYCWVQSFITRKAGGCCIVAILRFLVSAAVTICMLLYFSLPVHGNLMHRARAQWALVMLFLLFLSSFAFELRHYHFQIDCMDDREQPHSH